MKQTVEYNPDNDSVHNMFFKNTVRPELKLPLNIFVSIDKEQFSTPPANISIKVIEGNISNISRLKSKGEYLVSTNINTEQLISIEILDYNGNETFNFDIIYNI